MEAEEKDKDWADLRQKKTGRKIVYSILVILVILILGVVFVVPAFVSSGKGRQIILSKINESVDGKADFDDLSMSWGKGVTVTNFSFDDTVSGMSVRIKKITAKPDYMSFLAGEVSIRDTVVSDGNLKVVDKDGRSIELSEINSEIDLRQPGRKTTFKVDMAVIGPSGKSKIYADGYVNPKMTKQGWSLKGTSAEFKVEIEQLDLESLVPLFALGGSEIPVGGMLKAEIDTKIDDGRIEKLKGDMVLSNLKRFVDGREVLIDEPIRVNAEISTDKEIIKIDRLDISSSFCRVKCRGSEKSVSCEGTGQLGAIQEIAGQFVDFGGYVFAGQAEINTKLSFDKGRIKVKGQSRFERFAVGDGKKTTPSISADASFDIDVDRDGEVVQVGSVKVVSNAMDGPGDLEIRDSVIPYGEGNGDKLELTISTKLSLGKLQPFLDLFGFVPVGMGVGGGLKSEVSVSRKKSQYHVVIRGMEIEGLTVSYPGKKTLEQDRVSAVFAAEFDPGEQTFAVKDLELVSPQVKIVNGKFSQMKKSGMMTLDGYAECEYDWAVVGTILGGFLPEGLELAGERKDVIEFTSRYPVGKTDQLLANLNAQGKIGFEKASYMGLDFGVTEVEANIADGVFKVAPFSTSVNNGQFNFACITDFNRKPVFLRTPEAMHIVKDVQINDEMGRKLLMFLNPLFANSVNVSGVANFECEKMVIPFDKRLKNAIEIVGTVSMNNVQLEASDLLGQILSRGGQSARGQDITIRPTLFILRDGVLRYDDMQVDIGDNPINFKGAIGLDESLDMTITLPYTLAGKTVNIHEDGGGQRVTIRLKGTVKDPELDLGSLLEDQIKQQGEELLRKGLEELFKNL